MVSFVSSYRQLTDYERQFVDDFLRRLQAEAELRFERLTITLERISQSIVPAALDDRTRDLFAKPLVIASIRERVEKLADGSDLTHALVMKKLFAISTANMQNYFNVGEDGFPTPDLENLTEDQWFAIKEIEAIEEFGRSGSKRRIKLKLHDPLAALTLIAKFTGLDKTDNPEYLAYKAIPADLASLPQSAGVEEMQEQYARFIDD